MTLHRISQIKAINDMDAERLKETILSLPPEDRDRVISELKVALGDKLAAAAKNDRKKTCLARIAAARETQGGRNAIELLEGSLRRAGAPALEKLADKSLQEIDAIFAQSRLSTTERMAAKASLHRLGVIER